MHMQRAWAVSLLLVSGAFAGVAQSQASTSTAAQREQQIKRCREYWQPPCADLGVPDPKATPTPTPEPTPTPTPNPTTSTGRELVPAEIQQIRSLVADGPQGEGYPNARYFSVDGFIQTGWPIVVSYQIEPGTEATLEINPRFGAERPVRVTLPQSPDGAPQYYKFTVELPEIGGEVRIAGYSITARYLSPPAGGRSAAPVQILGFGAGPRAVGSVAIDQITGDPREVARPQGNAKTTLTYTYFLKNDWDRVAEDLWRHCTGFIKSIGCNFSHPRNPYRPSRQGPQRWAWEVDRHTDKGPYFLKVRAWHTCGALADPAAYDQCGSELDWVVGGAGPFFIR